MKTFLIISGISLYTIGAFLWVQFCRVQWKRHKAGKKGWDYSDTCYEYWTFLWPFCFLMLFAHPSTMKFFERILDKRDERMIQEDKDKVEIKRISDDLLP